MSIEDDEIFSAKKVVYKSSYVGDLDTKIKQLKDQLSSIKSEVSISTIQLEELKKELNELELRRFEEDMREQQNQRLLNG